MKTHVNRHLMNNNDFKTGKHPHILLQNTSHPEAMRGAMVNVKMLLAEYENNTLLNKIGVKPDTFCEICKEEKTICEDDIEHNLFGCEKIVSDPSYAANLAQIIYWSAKMLKV